MNAQFKDFSELLQICDASGKIVGYFQPVPIHDREIYDWAKTEFTNEEIERGRQSKTWYTSEEVLAYLKSL